MSDYEAKSHHFGDGGPGPQPTPLGDVNHDYSTSKKKNYVSRPPVFNGNSTEFEWWKSKMYTHIIDLDDEQCGILENVIDILVNGVWMVTDIKLSHLIWRRFTENTTKWEAFL